MTILEKFILSKSGHLEDCEDIIVINQHFAAVIDGATARSNALYGGKKSGLRAALLTQEVLERLPEDAGIADVLVRLEQSFTDYYREIGISSEEYDKILTASTVLYSHYNRQVWLIGDCRCRIGGKVYDNPNGIDDFVAAARCFVNQAEVLKGKSEKWISENDPGAQFIKKLLVDQFLFQNHEPKRPGSYHYAAVDGRKIHLGSVRTVKLGNGDRELILASDGYPVLEETLAESESALAKLLKEDPLCIYTNKCVKGLREGLVSFDDRAYLKISL